ncbi:DEAD/DEAH box helicase [Nitratireductor sp. OM-1]|uniref:DEAD/DEAH box helicase n=1 Tax=Nitratireductor sp. OM-1 TaxID=1756988 RepID=UPI0013AEA560|nr:DEAD/DEAH box helicase family protein [Nitratireductor sp. OM-1]
MALLSELKRTDKPLSTGATAVYSWKPFFEKKYRFTSRFGDEVELFRREGNVVHLPRALCPVSSNDNRADGEFIEFPNTPEPRPNQVSVFKATRKFLLKGESGLVSAYTGWGKTVLGYYAAAITQRKTLVITTKDDIYQQWIDGACGRVSSTNPNGTNFLGLDPIDVGEIRGDKCEVVGTKFVVAMIHSLSKDGKYPDWITEDFGLVIFDECHRVPADQFQTVVDMFPAKLRLGLSASIDRSDGKEQLVYAHIGPVRARTEAELMVPKVLRFTSNWNCPRVLRENEETGEKEVIRLPHQPGKTTHLEKMLAADPERNYLLAELTNSAFEKGRKLVVFSTLHDHLRSIHRLCSKEFKISGRNMGFYLGATTKADKEHREREKVKPILFTTYAMMGEGTSIDWLDTCILAMPRAAPLQAVGRIRREYPDKKEPVVMDVIDADSPVFLAYSNSRAKWYSSIGAEVKDML